MSNQVLFENKYDFDDKSLKKYVKTITKGSRISALFVTVAGVIFAIMEYRNNSKIFSAVLGGIAIVGLLAYFITVPRTLKNIRNQENILSEKIIQITFNHMNIFENNKERKVKFGEIVSVLEDDESMYLMVDKTKGVIIKKSGFTKGTFEEFKKFIDKKFIRQQPTTGG
ncbi:YcxB family protein [Miniphocaeibacter halophilus]|uniref:YcxB family protein n=1 Tax=Miniphocaeibacter halophilus TaxID=2931922 RepID=A0AC61MSN6_9FIRM|nr:YcxB family protein [Miniphocaeibacter halophilus]QQK08571.1 YcxB family protein [Miniphocaeibacter halophilus]